MITRETAWNLLCKHAATGVLRTHCRETELIMRALAERLGADPDLWGITGLLHDIDY
jgi:putative nucleotidyltransferase with HDIG domain